LLFIPFNNHAALLPPKPPKALLPHMKRNKIKIISHVPMPQKLVLSIIVISMI